MLKEQQEQEQQQLQQQQRQHTQKRLAVAVRFHQMLLLHKALVGWHKHAAIAAALSKLHPAVPCAVSSHACSSTTDSRAPGDAAAAMQLKAQQLLQRLAEKQQTALESAPPAATAAAAAAAPSNTHSGNSIQGASAERHQAQRESKSLGARQRQRQQQPEWLESCQCAALVSGSTEWYAVQPGHIASRDNVAIDALNDLDRRPPLHPQQSAAPQLVPLLGQAGHTTSHGATSCASASSTASCQELQEVPVRQPETAAAVTAVADDASSGGDDVAVTSDLADTAAAAAAGGGVTCEDVEEQQHLEQGNAQQALGSGAGGPVSQLEALAGPRCMTAAPEQPTMQQHEVQQQQQVRQQHDGDARELQPPAAEHQQQQQQQHDRQQQLQPEAIHSIKSSSEQQDTEAAQQLQLQPHRIGSIDRQQLQQKLRQLLAAEQRKLREEQRQEQLLAQRLAEQQEALAGMHYQMVLVRRLGLQPWLALLKLRTEQQLAAGSWRAVRMARAAMLLWKERLVQR
jgi:hypothetical protein